MSAIEIEIQRPYRRARVWLVDRPLLTPIAVRTIEEEVDTSAAGAFGRRLAVVELMVAAGARALYALSGAEFTPLESRRCKIQLEVCEEQTPIQPWALVASFDEVRAGLPAEFAVAVMNELRDVGRSLGGGVLRGGPFAHAGAGSSPHFFRFVTHLVGELLLREPSTLSMEAIEQILSSPLSP
ncbi:MAG: hypothetical protein KF782_25285 [Labilithrix sp.]|nr:hypothetical protein [Labilithrix sp.]